jgi:metal transporter CNNM
MVKVPSFVICLMYLMYPIAYPTALLLDYILGEDHGTVYKKAGLKTLVTLHKSLGSHPSDRLNEDEVTIISAVLDLKEKPVGAIMTPIKDVFTMSSDTILDVNTTNEILSAGYSRIPIHAPGEPTNFVGMLLVKVLITYDPEDEKRVGEFPLATLPETAEDTSCLDIVNFFQEGKSHMVLVSEYPGENNGALGVVTLEDVIEELIGEEIVDESDVFIDVHKAIRRLHPSPMAIGSAARRSISAQYSVHNTDTHALEQVAASHNTIILPDESIDLLVAERSDAANNTSSPNTKEVEVRRPSCSRAMGGFSDDIIAHLTLGPANLAGRPRETKSKTVKIKHTDSASRIPEDVAAAKLVNDSGAVDGSTASNGDMIKFDDPSHDDSLQEAPTTASANMNTNSKVSWGNENLLPSAQTAGGRRKKKARTGSLVERLDVVDGIPKTIIETTSSSEDDGGGGTESSDDHSSNNKTNNSGTGAPAAPADNNGVVASRGETTPLLRY